MYTIRERVLIALKWLLSYTKKNWTVDDYPVRVRRNAVRDASIGWMAQCLNWPGPVGLGGTPEEAKLDLQKKLLEISAHRHSVGESVPRPGVSEPIRFAPTVRVAASPELLDEFIEHVLGFPPGSPVFISDGSSLYDFGTEEEVERLHGLIRGRFGVETSDVPEGSIAAILERIAMSRTPPAS